MSFQYYVLCFRHNDTNIVNNNIYLKSNVHRDTSSHVHM